MKRRIWLAFAMVLVLAATAHFLVRSAEDKVTDRMLSGAGRFAIPADWMLVEEIVRPERFMCISTNPCPSRSVTSPGPGEPQLVTLNVRPLYARTSYSWFSASTPSSRSLAAILSAVRR